MLFFFFGWLVQVYTTVKVGDDSLQFVQTNTRFVQIKWVQWEHLNAQVCK
jgi:hypothetical protein